MSKFNKKPIYKKWWVWLIVILIIGGILGSGGDKDKDTNISTEKTETKDNGTAENKQEISQNKNDEESKSEEKIPTEYKSALKKAKTYSDTMHLSKLGIYNQLTSEYGEKFTAEAAQYAIDNVKADWKENALKKAKTYQETMSMSPSAIYDQLISEHGEKFTAEEAQYAIDNLK